MSQPIPSPSLTHRAIEPFLALVTSLSISRDGRNTSEALSFFFTYSLGFVPHCRSQNQIAARFALMSKIPVVVGSS